MWGELGAGRAGARSEFSEMKVPEEHPTKYIALCLTGLQAGVNDSGRGVQRHRTIALGWTGNMSSWRGGVCLLPPNVQFCDSDPSTHR